MKRNNKLTYAWCIFVVIAVAFVAWVETQHYFKHERAQSYQYRILISEDMKVADEKPSVSEEKEQVTKKDVEPELYEETKYGALPKISPDGMRVLDAYAARFEMKNGEKFIKVAVILSDKKCDDLASELSKLGSAKVSFIVPHYAVQLQETIKTLRENGHEVFLQLPTQSSIPAERKNEISPFLANANAEDTVLKLNCLLASGKYVIGVANVSPTLFTKSKKDMGIILEELSKRGMAFLDIEKQDEDSSDKGRGGACFSDFVFFDENFNVEKTAGKSGVLVPVKLLQQFLKTCENVALAPVTAGMKNADL